MVYLQRYLVVAWLVPRETAAISAHVLCMPSNHAAVYSVTAFQLGHVHNMVHECLAATGHLHFWQNDWGLLR